MATSVYCIALSKSEAESIVTQLRDAGFSSDDISALFSDKGGSRDFGCEKTTVATSTGLAGG